MLMELLADVFVVVNFLLSSRVTTCLENLEFDSCQEMSGILLKVSRKICKAQL